MLFVVAAIIFVLVEAAIVFAVFRYRRRGDMLPPQFHGNNLLEVVWTVVPLLIVAGLFVVSWGVLNRVEAKADNPRVTVNVLGFQWQWQFTYQGERLDLPAGQPAEDLTIKGTIAKPPVMYLPVGEPIRFNTQAQDVIHSFYVREFLFKRDAFPDHVNTFDLTITKPGDYGGQCTEYCGLAHQAMRFTVRAVSRPAVRRLAGQGQEGGGQRLPGRPQPALDRGQGRLLQQGLPGRPGEPPLRDHLRQPGGGAPQRRLLRGQGRRHPADPPGRPDPAVPRPARRPPTSCPR